MTPEQLAISQLRDKAGWYCGDKRAGEVLAEYAATLKAEKQYHMDAINSIAKAVNMLGYTSAQIAEDVAGAANSVVVASLLYPNVGAYIEQVEEQLAAMTQSRNDAVVAAHLVADELATLRMVTETGK
jgi:hypothetical protein